MESMSPRLSVFEPDGDGIIVIITGRFTVCARETTFLSSSLGLRDACVKKAWKCI